MAISNQVGVRSYRRVKNPSRASLSDVVFDANMASDVMGFSPYAPVIDSSGADQIVKVDAFSDVVPQTTEIALPPLGAPTVYDSLLGITLSEDQILQIYEAVKNENSIADVALAYEITQQQVSDIFTAILNGATPNDILNPSVAQFDSASTLPIRTMAEQSITSVDGSMAPSMLPGGLMMNNLVAPQSSADVAAQVPSSGISPMMIGIGALAALFLFKD
jgi:hypothetical protein